MDNQVTKHIKTFLTKNDCKLQLVEPHNHRVNTAEQAIQTFKNAFIAVLSTTDSNFPLQLWDQLTLQIQDTLNLLQTQLNQHMKSSTDHTTGTGIPWPHLDAKPLYTKMATHVGHGHQQELTRGTLDHLRTITDVT
jgi:hypothetical protein